MEGNGGERRSGKKGGRGSINTLYIFIIPIGTHLVIHITLVLIESNNYGVPIDSFPTQHCSVGRRCPKQPRTALPHTAPHCAPHCAPQLRPPHTHHSGSYVAHLLLPTACPGDARGE